MGDTAQRMVKAWLREMAALIPGLVPHLTGSGTSEQVIMTTLL